MAPKLEFYCIKCEKKFSTDDYKYVRWSNGAVAATAACSGCGGVRSRIVSKSGFSDAEIAKMPLVKSKTPKKSKSGGGRKSRSRSRRTGGRTRR